MMQEPKGRSTDSLLEFERGLERIRKQSTSRSGRSGGASVMTRSRSGESLARSFADRLTMTHLHDNKSPAGVVKPQVQLPSCDALPFGNEPASRARQTIRKPKIEIIPSSQTEKQLQKSSGGGGLRRRDVYTANRGGPFSHPSPAASPMKKKASQSFTEPRTSTSKSGRSRGLLKKSASDDGVKRMVSSHYMPKMSGSRRRSNPFDANEALSRELRQQEEQKEAYVSPSLTQSFVVTTKTYDGCGEPDMVGGSKANGSSYISVSTKKHDSCKAHSTTTSPSVKQQGTSTPGDASSKGSTETGDSTKERTAILNSILQTKFDEEAYVIISNLKWTVDGEVDGSGESIKRVGYYTGVIDKRGRPHGRGTWIDAKEEQVKVGEKEKLTGWWYEGM